MDGAWLWLLARNPEEREAEADELLLALAAITDSIDEFRAPVGGHIPQLQARVTAAQRLGRTDIALEVLNWLGQAYFEANDYPCAIAASEEAQRLARLQDHLVIESIAIFNLSRTYEALGEDERAAAYKRQYHHVTEKIVKRHWSRTA
ncbi:MAG: hypothetical protein HC914_22140 [Chloroflexaceae bacterium]|nr:hypothetical protein [Chloroflexaceae bacterium]